MLKQHRKQCFRHISISWSSLLVLAGIYGHSTAFQSTSGGSSMSFRQTVRTWPRQSITRKCHQIRGLCLLNAPPSLAAAHEPYSLRKCSFDSWLICEHSAIEIPLWNAVIDTREYHTSELLRLETNDGKHHRLSTAKIHCTRRHQELVNLQPKSFE